MSNTSTIIIDGFEFGYQIQGNGPNAIVIGSSLYSSRSFSQNLSKYLRLCFIDWRAFAKPPTSQNIANISFDTMLEDIERIRKELDLKNCIIIGHSAHALMA